jgi:hypothetical protein
MAFSTADRSHVPSAGSHVGTGSAKQRDGTATITRRQWMGGRWGSGRTRFRDELAERVVGLDPGVPDPKRADIQGSPVV